MSAPPPVGEDISIGRVIDGRYRVLRRIGEGGMGVVYEAEHLKLGKRVALKLIAPERIGDPEAAARFTREARATAQIEHPHIAAGFDYGLLPEGGAFLVAQLVRGTSLRAQIERGPLPWADACAIAAQIADALSAIHHAGYVHRDLTPENVLIASRDDGRRHAYVLDFGVAALVAAAPSQGLALTALGTIVGTQGYMSPEQALGKTVDARADLYVVGVLLWEMLAGRPLFSPRSSLTDVVSAQLSGEVPIAGPSAGAAPAAGVPFDLERLLRDLLSPDLGRRPTTAIDLRAELLRIVEGRPTDAVTSGVGSAAPIVAAPPSARLAGAAGSAAETEVAVALLGQARALLATRDARIALGAGAGLGVVLAITLAAVASSGTADSPASSEAVSPALADESGAGASPAGADVPTTARAAQPLDATIERMLRSRSHPERERLAAELLALPPAEVPPYARAAAALQVANTCAERSAQLELIRMLGDPRAIPAVEIVRDAPRRGCGRRGRSDCYACVRSDAEAILRELRAAQP